MISAAQAMQIRSALGPDVMRVTGQINAVMESRGTVPDYLWKELLAVLKSHSPELMETVPGRLFIYLIEEKINGNDASVRRRKPGGGFPSTRQF